MSTAKEVWHFFTKVVGIDQKNADGTNRLEIAGKCRPLDKLLLLPDRSAIDRLDHHHAVTVCRESGEPIGFLRPGLAEEILSLSRRGYKYAAFIKHIRRTSWFSQPKEVSLLVVVTEPGVTSRTAQAYVDKLELEPDKKPGGPGWLVFFLLVVAAAAGVIYWLFD